MSEQEIQAVLVATATSLGTGTTKTKLNGGTNITVPAWARNIDAIVPYASLVTITAAEALIAKLILESDDVAITPFEVPILPVQGVLGATAEAFSPKLEPWIVNCPVKGGEELAISAQALVSNTVAPYAGCAVVISNRVRDRQRFAKCGTATSTGTAAGEVSGTAYSVHGAEKLLEVLGIVTKTTIAASKPVLGYFRLESSDFKVAVPLKYPVTPVPPVLGALGNPHIGGITRFNVKVPTNTTCTIQDYFNNELAVTTLGYWLSTVIFNKVGR